MGQLVVPPDVCSAMFCSDVGHHESKLIVTPFGTLNIPAHRASVG